MSGGPDPDPPAPRTDSISQPTRGPYQGASPSRAVGQRSLDPEFLTRLDALRFDVQRSVEGPRSGIHQSRRRGASVVFAEHRDYCPGDDLRTLDWRAFARTDRHVVKRFEHEARLDATLVLDTSSSMDYGPGARSTHKGWHAAVLLGGFAQLLTTQGDASALARISGGLDEWVPHGTGPEHVQTVLEALLRPTSGTRRTSLAEPLAKISRRAGPGGAVVLASDLLDDEQDILRALSELAARGHQVLLLHVLHRNELDLPFTDPGVFVGLEGEPSVEADPRTVREDYLAELEAWLSRLQAGCERSGLRYVMAATDRPPAETLTRAVLEGSRGLESRSARWG